MMAGPSLPSGYDQHHVVVLEGIHCPLPKLTFPHKLTAHQITTSADVAQRIADATIVITTIVPVTPADLDQAPNVQCLAILATGIGWLDREDAARRGITVCHCPHSNIEAVGEHFLGLYFSSRRKIPEMHRRVTESSEWEQKGTLAGRWAQGPPLSCAKETLGIIGYGALGKRFEGLAKAVGFGKIIIADRKGVAKARDGRVLFEELVSSATTIVVCCPREAGTIGLISDEQFKAMRQDCLVINMARGGIVDEAALASALKERRIFGAATDVLDNEPVAPGSSPLLPDVTKGEALIPNLIISPHVAWFAQRTIDNLIRLLSDGVNGFVEGRLDEPHVRGSVVVHNGTILK